MRTASFTRQLGFILGLHRDLTEFSRETGRFKSVLDRHVVIGVRTSIEPSSLVSTSSAPASMAASISAVSSVPGANSNWPQCLNWKAIAAVGSHVAAVFVKSMANFSDGACAVVSQAIDHDSRAAVMP